MIKILGRPTAWNARKVLFLLEDIGLAYEREDYGRGFAPTNTPEFLALNPNGLVPVLLDGATVLWESHTILRYLAAKFAPDAYYPADLARRAVVDQWLDWKIAHISPTMQVLFYKHHLKIGDFSDRDVEEAEARCGKFFTILVGQLGKTGAYVAGEALTIADCSLGMAAHRWFSLPVKRPDTPHLSRYYRTLSERPSFQKTVLIGMP